MTTVNGFTPMTGQKYIYQFVKPACKTSDNEVIIITENDKPAKTAGEWRRFKD
jgi:hypothetical protein